MSDDLAFSSNSNLTITKVNKDPRVDHKQGALTSAGGTIYITSDPSEFLSLGVYKKNAPVSVALSNDVREDGDVTKFNFREDPDHDITSAVDYLKADTRGMTAAKIVRLADTFTLPSEIRITNLKNAK